MNVSKLVSFEIFILKGQIFAKVVMQFQHLFFFPVLNSQPQCIFFIEHLVNMGVKLEQSLNSGSEDVPIPWRKGEIFPFVSGPLELEDESLLNPDLQLLGLF